jgi:hypothetical protein
MISHKMSELRVESRLTAGTHSTYDLLTLLANEFRVDSVPS